MKRVGILRVVTSDDRSFLEHHQRLLQRSHPSIAFETRCLPHQPNGIHDAATLAAALPQIEALGVPWSHTLAGLIVSCAADPGVETLKTMLPIPVVGAGEACCLQAMALGRRIGVIGIEADAPPVFHHLMGQRLLGYRQPEGVNCTHDIHSEAGKRAIIDAIKDLEAQGAEVIALACTGMATTDVPALAAPYTSLSIVNPVLAAGNMIAQKIM